MDTTHPEWWKALEEKPLQTEDDVTDTLMNSYEGKYFHYTVIGTCIII